MDDTQGALGIVPDGSATPPTAVPTRLMSLAGSRSDSTLLTPGHADEEQAEVVNRMWSLMGLLYKPHPWHGVSIGAKAPDVVTSFIEIVPGAANVKLEIDKRTGYLKVDRPNKFSSVTPVNYGFLPCTYCGPRVAGLCTAATGIEVEGDHDPLDICVLSEKAIGHGNLLMDAVPIGGLRMIDGGEADDKIIAVMKDDAVYGDWTEITDMPESLLNRIIHYFLTYKQQPGEKVSKVSIPETYGRATAHEVILASLHDYEAKYSNLRDLLTQTIFKAVLSSGGTFSDDDA